MSVVAMVLAFFVLYLFHCLANQKLLEYYSGHVRRPFHLDLLRWQREVHRETK